jgi:hypothetical protein
MVLPFPWSSSRALTTWDSIGIIGRELPESTLAGLGGDLVAVVPLNASGRSSSTEDIRSCSFSRLNCVCHQESTTLEYHSAKQNSTHGPLWVERQTRHRRCSLLFEEVPQSKIQNPGSVQSRSRVPKIQLVRKSSSDGGIRTHASGRRHPLLPATPECCSSLGSGQGVADKMAFWLVYIAELLQSE